MIVKKLSYQSWNLVAWVALGISIMLAIIVIIHGINEPSMRLAIRATARTSCILFIAAFVAAPLQQIWRNSFTQWLRRNRRYLGVSFAVSHGFHAIAIFGLAIVTSGDSYQSDPGGMLGYLFIVAMTLTSFNRTAAWLGQRPWQILHTVGMYYLWLAFLIAFSGRLSESILLYLPIVILLILAIMLRLLNLKFGHK